MWKRSRPAIESKYYVNVARKTALRKPKQSPKSSVIIVLIGLFKLLKALLLIVIGIGAIKFLHKDIYATVMHWAEVLRVDPDNHVVHSFLNRVFRITPKQLKELSVGTFLYAGLFATEGVGLLLRKRWAEYFTIVTTGLLIPIEIYELQRHFTMTKVAVLAINVAIVWYLVRRVRTR
jgi:uncharacterized membrane protein (DUF2068 family)